MAISVGILAARIAKIDSGIQWKNYTALSALSIVAGHKKSVLETSVFGKDKPTSDFRRAYARGKQLVGHAENVGLSKDYQATVRTMAVDDAVTAVLVVLDNHMRALGADSAKLYDERREYADKAAMPEAAADEPEAGDETAAPVTADKPEGATVADVLAILADKDDEFLLAIHAFIEAKLMPAPQALPIAA